MFWGWSISSIPKILFMFEIWNGLRNLTNNGNIFQDFAKHYLSIVDFCSFFRQICVDDGQELSLQYGCQFYEVSAAENFAGVSLAFQSLLREARSVQLLKALPIRRKLGVNSVSKVLGNIFGKNSKGDRKKRPSLSI